MNSRFHFKMFSGTFRLDFSIGSVLKLKMITLDTDDWVDLYTGRVFGAIKYKGKWIAARITKHR